MSNRGFSPLNKFSKDTVDLFKVLATTCVLPLILYSCSNIVDQTHSTLQAPLLLSDTDKDGVLDSHDKCISELKGQQVNKDGCPLDSDGDGTPDILDVCEDTISGRISSISGCVVSTLATYRQSIHGFHFASSDVTPTIKEKVSRLINAVSPLDSGEEIFVFGYADTRGTHTYNKRLSEQRAKNVRDYLVSLGIDESIVTYKGFGASHIISWGNNETSLALNRRVEIVVNVMDEDI